MFCIRLKILPILSKPKFLHSRLSGSLKAVLSRVAQAKW